VKRKTLPKRPWHEMDIGKGTFLWVKFLAITGLGREKKEA